MRKTGLHRSHDHCLYPQRISPTIRRSTNPSGRRPKICKCLLASTLARIWAQVLGTFDRIGAAQKCTIGHWMQMSIAQMIFSGVFERYPKLQVGAVEAELSWVPYFIDRLDFHYTQQAKGDRWYIFKEAMLPSQYFHRNMFLGFQEDALGIRLRDVIGVDKLQWGSDYPHHESTWPKSQQILEEILADCTEEEKAKIAGGNASRIYRLA